MTSVWNVQFLVGEGRLDRRVGDLLERLIHAVDPEEASQLAIAIELTVAPPSGGLSADAAGVVDVVTSCLPVMDVSARSPAIELLFQIGGSLLYADAAHLASVLVGSLASVAALAQDGDRDIRGVFVDFAAMCTWLDPSVVEQVRFYLRQIVETGGAEGEGAQIELDELDRPRQG